MQRKVNCRLSAVRRGIDALFRGLSADIRGLDAEGLCSYLVLLANSGYQHPVTLFNTVLTLYNTTRRCG